MLTTCRRRPGISEVMAEAPQKTWGREVALLTSQRSAMCTVVLRTRVRKSPRLGVLHHLPFDEDFSRHVGSMGMSAWETQALELRESDSPKM